MAFWGIEVKPGKPFIHAPNNGRRLHISQATLGTGSSMKNSVVQCNVGNSSPVYLCSLFPEKTEISQLHLEFEETVEVIFSVIGPRSVHLTGYYLGGRCGQHFHPDDETESYGEDIADTETERSANGSDEDEYEDSFINDDEDPEIMSPSTVYSSEVEEIFDKKKRKNGKGSHKRLRKKFQFIESDDEDKMPISFLHERESAVKGMGSEAVEKCEKEKGETSEKKVKDNGNWVTVSKGNAGANLGVSKRQIDDHHSFLPSSDMGSRNDAKSKKREKHYKEEVPLEDDFFFCRALGQQKSIQSEAEADKLDLDLPVTKEDQKTTNDKNVEKLKRRRKKYAKEKESLGADNHLSYKHKAQSDEAEAKNTLQDMLVTNKESHEEKNDEFKNTLQDMLVTDKGNQKDTNDEEDKVQDEAKAENTGQAMLLVKKENQKQADDEAALPWNSNLPPTQLDPESVTKPKKKRKHANKKVLDAIKEHEGEEDDFKTDSHDHELPVQDEHENGAKPKRKRKERADKKIPGTHSGSHNNTIKEEEGKQDEDKSTSLDPLVFVQEEQNQKQQSFVTFNVDQSAEESHSKKKRKKRKNEESKKSRTRESMEASNGINA
ncbi:PREDICTED: peptidyl-prolyl cis-trans isomerase FKBP43-like isoform X2 [Populus euphratica]|uniref:peptidylprolyl isomerase n=1 Tax=Populus euphratica TaxID=75702 RepID=A0AAJ6UJN6_POPEU|nr:PREDICTED: peptidyl-prolyl cis-trans isomerase FKBP43-like isoform X2 [Populus euphratica]